MDTLLTTLVDGILVPLINLIVAPVLLLVSSGLLVLVFAAAWVALGVAIVRVPARVEAAWQRLRRTPLVVQAVAWVLFLPVLAGVVVWRMAWPAAARLALVGGLAGWNLLMFLPPPG